MIQRWGCFLFFLFCIFSVRSQGLLFQAGDKQIKERTSLQIFPEGKEPLFTKNFQLKFDLSIRNFDVFGYLFLLKETETGKNFSFTYTYLDSENGTFKFNTDGKRNHYALNLCNDALAYRWIPVSFSFDLQRDSLTIRIGEYEKTIGGLGFRDSFRPSLCMGRYDYILDIPSFAIRNLKLIGDDRSYSFPLNESTGGQVHTTTGEVLGEVVNPVWLINNSYHWKPLFELHTTSPSGITFDQKGQRLIAFNQDSILYYDVLRHKQDRRSYANSLPVKLQLATHFLNTATGKLYVYELNNLPLGDATVAALDLETLDWAQTGTASLPVQLHHHDGFLNEVSGKYTVFGGFGNQRYNNTFLDYDVASDRWDTISYSGDFIAPRFFSGMAVSTDRKRMYVYGGMGNESGDQSVGRNYFHDLYQVDVDKKSIRRLWQNTSDESLVSARDMILSDDEQYIYALCYPEYLSDTYLQLCRLSVADGSVKVLGDSISMHSDEIATNANLYYNQLMHEYYCTIQEFDKAGNVVTRAYVLSDPPVSLAEVQQYDATLASSPMGWRLILSSVLLAGIAVLLWLWKRKKSIPVAIPAAPEAILAMAPSDIPAAPLPKQAEPVPAVAANAIYLFGSFTVINRNGRDITHLFSSRLRQVFIYILLHSNKNGVQSVSLNEAFWPDKPDDKVKNLKGVTINQIRKNLAELDGIELIYDKGYFRLIFTHCYCDYNRFRALREASEREKELGSLLIRGKFLEGFDSGVLDQFKLQVEEFLFSFLPLQIERLFLLHKYDAVIRFCHILFGIDPLNETSLVYCIQAMNRTGASQEAIMQYSAFVREYKQTMNEDYSISYSTLISENPPFHR